MLQFLNKCSTLGGCKGLGISRSTALPFIDTDLASIPSTTEENRSMKFDNRKYDVMVKKTQTAPDHEDVTALKAVKAYLSKLSTGRS